MIRFVMAVFAGLVISNAVQAADQPVQAPLYKAAPAVFNWSGFYVGAQVGYGWGNGSWQAAPGGLRATFPFDGAIGGATLGYNWQRAGSNWVYGIEADISSANINGTGFAPCSALGCSTALEWFGTVRGRLGYSQNNALLYVTGGVAFGSLHYTSPAGGVVNYSETQVGWTAGAGLEIALRRNWSLKGEYLYVDLGESNPFSGTVFGDTNHFHITRLGVNYRW